MKLIFVRHGKDDDRYRGGWSSLGLIPEGIAQAERLADQLAEENYGITRILSSDLRRTLMTAQYIGEKLGLPIELEPRLRETNNGDLAGMLNSEALQRYPGLFFSTLAMDQAYPNGESPRDFYLRIKSWFLDFCTGCDSWDGNVLIVTHGGVINVIYHLVNDIPWTNKELSYKAANCSIHILNTDTMRFEVENKTDFLAE